MSKQNKIKKKYLVTSISNGDINFKFLDSMLNYCRHNNAKLIICPTKNFNKNTSEELQIALGEYLSFGDVKLNKNIKIVNLRQSEFVTDQTAGLESNMSLILPGITQRMRTRARQVSHTPYPLIFQVSGSINNKPKNYISKSQYKAAENWVTGAVVVDTIKSGRFHLRNVEFDGDGFQDLGEYYSPENVVDKNIAGLVLGDLHPGEECPVVMSATYKIIETLKPETLVLHDYFNGHSVSHWTENNRIARATTNECLSSEGEYASNLINSLAKKVKTCIMIYSNHPEFLNRWISTEGRTIASQNLRLFLELSLALLDRLNPVEILLKKFNKLSNCIFLKEEDEYRICGIKVSNHGHKGTNGARGSVNSATKDEIQGHTHSPQITKSKGAYIVGTSTHLSLMYTSGQSASTWLNTHCLVFKNGKRQLIHIIKGKFGGKYE
jgi:hypothetical protein